MHLLDIVKEQEYQIIIRNSTRNRVSTYTRDSIPANVSLPIQENTRTRQSNYTRVGTVHVQVHIHETSNRHELLITLKILHVLERPLILDNYLRTETLPILERVPVHVYQIILDRVLGHVTQTIREIVFQELVRTQEIQPEQVLVTLQQEQQIFTGNFTRNSTRNFILTRVSNYTRNSTRTCASSCYQRQSKN